MSAFLDTNVLLYAFKDDDWRAPAAEPLLTKETLISVQVLNEFVTASRRKRRLSWGEIRRELGVIERLLPPPRPLTMDIHRNGVDIAERYGFRIYDSLILASALEAGCDTLYSEDMQHGQVIDGLTICNPFR